MKIQHKKRGDKIYHEIDWEVEKKEKAEDTKPTSVRGIPISYKDWGSVDKGKLPATSFFNVPDREKTSTWSYPYREGAGGIDSETGRYTKAGDINYYGVVAALAAAHGARGGSSAPQPLRGKIESLASEMGIGKKEVAKEASFDIEKLSNAQKKEYKEETDKIRENAKKPEALEKHEFKAAKWTHPNGHPRCLLCGNDSPIGSVCNMPDSWYQKFEWDDEEAWAKERKSLKERKVIKSEEINKSSTEYSLQYFAELDAWDENTRKMNEEITAGLADGSVLDLGCATGRLLKMLKDGGRKVVGVENSEIAIGWCVDRDLEIQKIDLNDLPLPFRNGEFDNVIAINTLEYLENPTAVAEEMERIAAKKVAIVCPLGMMDGSKQKHVFTKSEDIIVKFGRQWKAMVFDTENAILAECEAGRLQSILVPQTPYDHPVCEIVKSGDIETWAKDKFPICAEECLDGVRLIIEKSRNKVESRAYTADYQLKEGEDENIIKESLTKIVGAVENIPGDFILDCFVKGGKAYCFDLPYWEMDLHGLDLIKRRTKLEEFMRKYTSGNELFTLTSFNVVSSLEDLNKKIEELSKLPESDGVMLKRVDSEWSITQETGLWGLIEPPEKLSKEEIESMVKGSLDRPQKCKYCTDKAVKGYVWAEGRAYIPVCEKHCAKARHQIESENNDAVEKIVDLPQEKEKGEKIDISKPFPGYHAARLKSPGQFDPDTYRTTAGGTIYGSKKVPSTINIIWAKVKPEDQPQPQALRFSTSSWTVESAQKWLAGNNIKYIAFEAASKEKTTKGAMFRIMKRDEALQVVGGIVYEPGSPSDTDTQGDYTDSKEIGDAMRKFMIAYANDQNKINVMHEGRAYMFPIIESFQPEEDTRKGSDVIKKGAWWMMLKVTSNSIWKAIVDGKLNGFSMEGTAKEGK